jgi:ubiquitin carboxyl-terminal hydrolase 8
MNLEKVQYDYDFHKHYNLKIKKSTYKGKGLCGLVNLGNFCYANSILQCLFNTMSLTDYFLSARYQDDLTNENKKKNEHYVFLSYLTLVNNIFDSNQVIKPKSFIENLSKFHKKYFSMTQQDSHECLLYILEILHNSLSYAIEVEIKGDPSTKADEMMKKSLESWQKFYENSYSFIIETFNGCNINNIICGCGNTEVVFEPYNSLSLDITGGNLVSCLEDYFKSDEKIPSYTCEKCKENGKTSKEVKLWTVPNYLIIHLKRFKQTSQGMVKNSHFVDFPLKDLDITQFISKDKNDTNNYIYDLYAVSQHSGTLEMGHYWASCKNLDGNWYNFNDTNVSKYNTTSTLVTNDAYILFYQRKYVKRPIQI